MCCGSFPNAIGVKISGLKRGDEVIILKGEGTPPVQKETVAIIWQVDGHSALTTDGVALSCQDLSDLIVTGRTHPTFSGTAETLLFWNKVQIARREEGVEPDWSERGTFPSEPE